MARIQFDIKYRSQIESGEYIVKTRSGNPVRIICWDRDSSTPICALITRDSGPEDYVWTNKEGRNMKIETDDDLFIITPDPDLSEFEKACAQLYEEGRADGESGEKLDNGALKESIAEILRLARKEIEIETPETKENIIRKIREQVEKWMPEKDGKENTHGKRTAFNSVLNLLKEIENE